MLLLFYDQINIQSVNEVMVNQTYDCNSSVSISVNKSGTYYATIFAIINGSISEFPSYSSEFIMKLIQTGMS